MAPSLPFSVAHFITLLFLISIASLTCALDVSIPLQAISSIPKISPSHISLSLELDRWTDWAGNVSRNEFFFNTLDNLNQITGKPPNVRIGGNSMDATAFRADVQFVQESFPPPSTTTPYPEAHGVTVGDLFYEAARFLPPNTHVTFGVNLGSNNITTAFLQARSIMKAFSSSAIRGAGIVLEFLEIGNEPDLYKHNGHRASTYNSTQYVKEWITLGTHVCAAAGLRLSSTSTTKFLGASFAGSSHSTTGFSPQAIFNAGLLDSAPGKLISAMSQHRYSGTFCGGSAGLLQDLMTKANIRSNLTVFIPDITATKAKGLDYILGETNSYSCHGAPGVSDTAGVALWALDYSLFATQIGISTVHFHAGIGFKYNMIQPITLTRSIRDGSTLPQPLPAHIQPEYYAAIITGEAIGKSGNTQIQELTLNDPHLTGYAFYEGGNLARAVFINLKAYTGAAVRTSVYLNIGFTGSSPPLSMTVKRLAIKQATDVSGITWGGQTYETSDGRVSGSPLVEVRTIAQGIDIQETEVILVQFT